MEPPHAPGASFTEAEPRASSRAARLTRTWCSSARVQGYHEDQEGSPFVGRAGQLLDRMIAAMGYERDGVYICNVVKCRPPENRTPLPTEAQACAHFLVPQLELVQPKAIVALGRCAAENLQGRPAGGSMARHLGRVARNPRDADLPSRIPLAEPAVQEARLGRPSGRVEGAQSGSAEALNTDAARRGSRDTPGLGKTRHGHSAERCGLHRWPVGLGRLGHASRPSGGAPIGAACCLADCHFARPPTKSSASKGEPVPPRGGLTLPSIPRFR